MDKAKCFDCDFELELKGYKPKEIIECPSCGCEYEIIFKDGKLSIITLELDGLDYGE